MWGAYAISDDVNILVRNLLVESGHVRLASYIARHEVYYDFWLTASGEAMQTMHEFSYSILMQYIFSTPTGSYLVS